MSALFLKPCTRDQANEFIVQHHRHHGPVVGYRFALAAADLEGKWRGVVVVGRPVARGLDYREVAEVTRLCSDGYPNVCSFLYAAARRAAKALGYAVVITYTLERESGVSLRAAGWERVCVTRGGSWSCESRPRVDKHPLERKVRWAAAL